VVAYFVAGGFTPVQSERLYLAWPPVLLICWLAFRQPGRLTRKQQVSLALASALFGAVLALDFVSGVSALRPGELTRMTYCLLGFGLAMMVLRRLLAELLKKMMPAQASEQARYRLPITIAWVLCYAAIAYPYFLSYMQIHPPRRIGQSDPGQALRLEYSDVSWRSFDNTTLRGWFVPAGDSERTAIVCHGVMDSKSGMMSFVQALHEGGYNVLAFDMRGHGESDRWTVTYGERESRDIIAGVDYLASAHPDAAQHVVGVGWSTGAASLILAAAQDPRIEALHIDAAYARTSDMARHIGEQVPALLRGWTYYSGLAIGSLETGTDLWRLSTADAVRRISPRPVMIIHGTRDRVVPFEQGEKVFGAANSPKSFHAVPGAGHCQTIAAEGRQYTSRMIRFLDDAIDARIESGTPGMPGAK
jgi:fermentation-respiration switch protein FrsA (DUF1100 family)